MLVEYARNCIGLTNAVHAEYGIDGDAIVTLLACSPIAPGSLLETVYGSGRATERTTCNYGLEPAFAYVADAGGLRVSAVDASGEVRAVERVDHPFFVGTLYQPQLSTSVERPHPIWLAFVNAVIAH